jgi:hypothetical protein
MRSAWFSEEKVVDVLNLVAVPLTINQMITPKEKGMENLAMAT